MWLSKSLPQAQCGGGSELDARRIRQTKNFPHKLTRAQVGEDAEGNAIP
jgi:hypothetical protein